VRLNLPGSQDYDPSLPWVSKLQGNSIVHTDGGTITLSVSQERWDKVKKILAWVAEQMAQGDTVDFKMLERHGGFLVYIVRTYPMVNP